MSDTQWPVINKSKCSSGIITQHKLYLQFIHFHTFSFFAYVNIIVIYLFDLGIVVWIYVFLALHFLQQN